MNFTKRSFLTGIALAAMFVVGAGAAQADSLLDKAKAGEAIRIGFANEVPWAYPGENNAPLGFANAHAVGVLNAMGITNIEPVVTDWGGLIPGLKANRFDVITGGMYILGTRCENVNFAEPMGVFGDAFIVAPGNPGGLETYQDIKNAGAVIVTGAGYNIVEVAKKEGIAEGNIMQVPGPTEILAAVKAGRADAGGVTFFTAQNLAKESGGAVEVTDPSKLPEWTLNWVGIAFRPSDTDFLAAFNEAQADYLGSEEMLAAVAEYGYTKAQLPGGVTTDYACANR
ncbi:MAG: transporter substrate-binding domain-containing protein [Kiloniellales bacterium]|nr:transporter substrate-binding domain-containing protein [Kiloniellales bacterium]